MTTEDDLKFIKDADLVTWSIDFHGDSATGTAEGEDRTPVPFEQANAYGSARYLMVPPAQASHAVMLDLDRNQVRLIPSSTEGHFHLVIPGHFEWTLVERLLDELQDMLILEPGFVNLAKQRKQVFLRLPGVKKEQ